MRWRLEGKMTSSGRLKTLAFFTLLGLFLAQDCQAQRLSQGASDWYMRFYSNMDYVKRNVDAPVTKSFVVTANIEYRYATTRVTTVVHNPANVAQNYTFGFVMPKEALVSNVTIVRSQPSAAGAVMDNEHVEHIQTTQSHVKMNKEQETSIEDSEKNHLHPQDW